MSTRREPFVELAPRLVLPRLNPLRVQGKRLRGQYYPLCKRHLEWQLKLHSGATGVQEEQDRITQVILSLSHNKPLLFYITI